MCNECQYAATAASILLRWLQLFAAPFVCFAAGCKANDQQDEEKKTNKPIEGRGGKMAKLVKVNHEILFGVEQERE